MRRFFDWLEGWALDDPNELIGIAKMGLVTVVALALVFGVITVPLIYFGGGDDAESECLASGGGWARIGEHQELTPVYVGKSTMLMPLTVADYGCVEVRR